MTVVLLKDVELRAFGPRNRAYKRADERGLYKDVRPNGSKFVLRIDDATALSFFCIDGAIDLQQIAT